ncbi:bacillithiol biosynthesis deacetylase BshB2 [Paenibacillus sinopodophylli]|uniref:bacillithiol biosynthesis deacetylase BshB2 n=1 Tax=Paenibacillus sinopodophylli TaxID=1837342 RepID=UPI00110C8E44|nr:bacillithiol biosynthesis deacetylase BshB2 [Paenibacillus sinopodophylli]
MSENILVVFPHPDDEAFTVSGTLAKHIEAGAHITYACLTLGEMGRNMGIPPFANRVTLPHIRKIELERSCEAIGIQDLRMLGFHDKMIEFEDQVLLDSQLDALLKELRPTIVYTFYPGFSVHPDHDACGESVIRTIGRLPQEEQPIVYCVAFSKNHQEVLGKPHVVNDVKEYLKPKMTSIEAHRSQFQAAELLGSKKLEDEEIRERYGWERFWIYPFHVSE